MRALCIAVAVVIAGGAAAADWPSQPIRMIVPFGPGGPTDTYTRVIGEELRKALGQPLVFENRPGAGTILGTTEASRAAPDGHTLLMVSATQTTVETLNPNKPYRLLRDFTPVAPLMGSDLVMAVNKDSPAQTLKDYIALAKAKPGTMNFGSSGHGSNYHMAAELLMNRAGISLVHVPYRGSSGARNDIISGQIEMMFDATPTTAALILNGNLRGLAVTGTTRAKILPDVPTFTEAGLAGMETISWIGVMAPMGVPSPIVERLNTEINKILTRPDIDASWRAQGADPIVMSPKEFGAMLQAEIGKWESLIRANAIKVE